jgi:exosortase/archaeosortase family protein
MISDYKNIKWLLLKVVALSTIWFVGYALLLKPNRIIDRPLTNLVTEISVKLLNVLNTNGNEIEWQSDSVRKIRNLVFENGVYKMGIMDACNGLDLIFVYALIILLLPSPSISKRLYFLFFGIIAIIFADVIRVVSFSFLSRNWRPAFEISHHYIFTIIMYMLIFYGWLLFIYKKNTTE